jgi:hypothetical protein
MAMIEYVVVFPRQKRRRMVKATHQGETGSSGPVGQAVDVKTQKYKGVYLAESI